MPDDEEEDWYPPLRPIAGQRLSFGQFCLSVVAWGLLCLFTSGLAGLCVRVFHFSAWE